MKGNKMRLEYKNQTENAFKFWEIKIEAKKKVITKYGRIGIQNPAETENKFSSEEAARKYAEKKIREKMNKGYLETK
tara:strand:- start:117 stop:347 length:231 start_codon:yes stop_codon:yes gene_type:complete